MGETLAYLFFFDGITQILKDVDGTEQGVRVFGLAETSQFTFQIGIILCLIDAFPLLVHG